MSQSELAARAGLGRPTLNRIVLNQVKECRAGTIRRIASALGVSADCLISRKTPEIPETERQLTGEQRAILFVMEQAGRLGWEEIARRLGVAAG